MLNGEFLKSITDLIDRKIITSIRIAHAFKVTRQTIWHWKANKKRIHQKYLDRADRIFAELRAEEKQIKNILTALSMLTSVQANTLGICWNTIQKIKEGKTIQLRHPTLKKYLKEMK